MKDYYSEKLSAERLRRIYELAPAPVKRYLEAEIQFVMERIRPGDLVLELNCGYGRVLEKMAKKTEKVIGIDTSLESLYLAKESKGCSSALLFAMNGIKLGFRNNSFDLVICIQNGISAFNVNHIQLIKEALRVTRSGGRVLFSSYSKRFWYDRLNWFRIQAEHSLLGAIDEKATGNGVIVCKDGFRATTVGPEDFRVLTSRIGLTARITEVKGSSIFCEIEVP